MRYIALRSFVDKFDAYQKQEQEAVVSTLDKIKEYMETNEAPYGLRIKKLSQRIYEARINIHLRIVYFRDKDVIRFFGLGNHDDIKRCLKRLK